MTATFQPLLSEGVQLAQLYNESHGSIESSTAPALASSGTITTSGLNTSRIAPTAAITAVILQAGLGPCQSIWVVNEGSQSSTVTLAASATSNAAGGVNEVIPGGQGRQYVWDDQTNLWYATPQLATVTALTQSASAPTLATTGTIATSGVGVARIAPTAAVTAAILQAGSVAGQQVSVVNEATATYAVTMAASATSNVADGASTVIAVLTCANFTWDSSTSLWYHAK
jgi:hypothetical protein